MPRDSSGSSDRPNKALLDAERELEETCARNDEIDELVAFTRRVRLEGNFVEMIKVATNPTGIPVQQKE
jgi:hypothetical protein